MNDLGALGSFEMKRIASNVYEFVQYVSQYYGECVNGAERPEYLRMI